MDATADVWGAKVKVLTLTQPWATLAAIGAKKIETRSWSTSYRGQLAIHAARGLGPVGGMRGLLNLISQQTFSTALAHADITMVDQLPLGAIVAVCELIDVCQIQEPTRNGSAWYRRASAWECQPEIVISNERDFGDYAPGRFAWLLSNAHALPEPVAAKGALGLWSPDTLTEMAVTRQLIATIPHARAGGEHENMS